MKSIDQKLREDDLKSSAAKKGQAAKDRNGGQNNDKN